MRTGKSIKNVGVMLLTQFITLVLSFISRTIFIKTLGSEYLGFNGLFANVLNGLSLAEMGIGTAISYALYKPIAENNIELIKSLLAFYRKCYLRIGLFIICIGLLLIPFLPYLIKDAITVPVNIIQIYLCFLANSAFVYFFAHKRIIIDISQNKYITSTIDFAGKTMVSIIQIFILLKFQNYMFFLYVQIIGTIVSTLIIKVIANKKFPYIKEKSDVIPLNFKKKIWNDISILFLFRVGSMAMVASDFVLISAFVGISQAGIYSNYTLIINTISLFICLFISGTEASIGNAIVSLNKDNLYNVFKKISFFVFFVSGISMICLLNLLNPFIKLWIGNAFVLQHSIAIAISINFFFMQNRILLITFKQNAGIFRPDRYKPLLEIIFNFGLSIILVKYYEILGVLIGSIANIIFVCICPEAYIIHKHLFKRSPWIYAKSYLIQILALLVACAISLYINAFIDMFVLKCLVSISVSVLVYFLFFFKTEEFGYFVGLFRKMAKI
jgi:O-antigen/teichoic acid export membrane protein